MHTLKKLLYLKDGLRYLTTKEQKTVENELTRIQFANFILHHKALICAVAVGFSGLFFFFWGGGCFCILLVATMLLLLLLLLMVLKIN